MVHGRVLDGSGQPVARAIVSPCWSFPDPRDEAAGGARPAPTSEHASTSTDEQGKFTIERGERWALLAIDEKQERGALSVIDPLHADEPLTLLMSPLIELRFRFDVQVAGEKPRTLGAWPFPVGARFSPVGRSIGAAGEFRFWLPAGDYEIAYSTDTFDHDPGVSTGVIATLKHDPVDLGAVRVELPRVVRLTGRVLADGQPVAGADVATYWFANKGDSQPRHGTRTDVGGRFELKAEAPDDERPGALLALDAARERAGVVLWKADSGAPLTIELGPAISLHGSFSLDGREPPPTFESFAYVSALPGQIAISTQHQRGTFDFRLPAGRYRLVGYGGDSLGAWGTKQHRRELELAADHPDVDLGCIPLPAPSTVEAVGKPAPAITITDARGIDKRVTLSEYKGKWVLLEFWAFW